METWSKLPLRNFSSGVAGRLAILVWAALVVIGAVIWLMPAPELRPLISAGQWSNLGGFTETRERPNSLPASIVSAPDFATWRSWSPETNSTPGEIETESFQTDSPTIGIPLLGYPAAPGIDVRLENLTTGEAISVAYGNVHEWWQAYLVSLPPSWRGQPLRLVASSTTSAAYVGIGTPYASPRSAQWLFSLPSLVFVHAGCVLFVLCGTGPLPHLIRRRSRCPLPLARLLALALLGLVAFFLYYFFPGWAPWICLALFGSGCVIEFLRVRQILRRPGRLLPASTGILLWGVISLASVLLLHGQQTNSLNYAANYRFSPASWSTDNQIPIELARLLREGDRLAGWDFGTWLVSDRPPVLAGIIASSYSSPIYAFARGHRQLVPLIAQTLAACVLSLWVWPTWHWLRRRRFDRRSAITALLLLAATPFVFFNTVYVWPKLLSGALALTGWILLASGPRPSIAATILGGLAFGLALMAHGGIAFGLLAMGLVWCALRLRTQFALLPVWAGTALLVVLPWIAWTHTYDPPGNALTKLAFAGTLGLDSPEKGVIATVMDAYRQDNWDSWIGRRVTALNSLLGTEHPITRHMAWPEPGNRIRFLQFFHLLPALGTLAIGLVLLPFSRTRTGRKPDLLSPLVGLLIAALGLLVQIVLMWDHHVVHHYSYSTILILHLVAVMALWQLPRAYRLAIIASSMATFLYFWVLDPAIAFGGIRPSTFGGAVLLWGSFGLFPFLSRATRNPLSPEGSPAVRPAAPLVRNTTGYCTTCPGDSTFQAHDAWLRDSYLCTRCGSIPRERALMWCLDHYFPNWASMRIHESSPVMRGASARIARECPAYLASQYFPEVALGGEKSGVRCENLESLTFPDESIDLHVSQDVLEHVLDPGAVFREVARTLRPGGAHVFTTPLVEKAAPSQVCVSRSPDGGIIHHREPEYHGNPISEQGSLVTRRWGYDITDFIARESGLHTTIVYLQVPTLGIEAEYIEVLISRKPRS